MGLKRGMQGTQAMEARQMKLASELDKTEKVQNDAEHDELLNKFISLVVGDTSMIKTLIGQAEVLKQGAQDTAMLPRTYIYVSKVPKENITKVLPAMSERTSVQALVAATKADKRADLKLCYMGAAMDSEQKIMNHEKQQYIEIMVARHPALGKPLSRATCNPDASINWDKSGFFELLPPVPAGADPATHRYEPIKCHALTEDNEARLPPAFNVTGAWIIRENWRLSTKRGTLANVRPQVRLKTADMFATSLKFKELLEPLPVYGKREARKSLAASSSAAPPDNEAGETTEEPKDADQQSRLKKALARLKRGLS